MTENPFKRFLARNILLTNEVAEKLSVSRQRISVLHKEGELIPIKSNPNSSVYLLQDVLQYMEKKGLLPKYECPAYPRMICDDFTTDASVLFFKKNKDQMNSIERVSIFFNSIDAAIENYFYPLNECRRGDLMELFIPHMILCDSDGNEMWLPGCNCGYGGEGPNGSIDILDILKIPASLINAVKQHRIVKYIKNEEGNWEVHTRPSDFILNSEYLYKRDVSAKMYWHQGRLTLVQKKDHFFSVDDYMLLLDKYWAFIPHPVEYTLFSSVEQAIDYGFFDPSGQNGLRNGAYRLIIRDYSGRQLWLDTFFDQNKSLAKQPELRHILEACGFAFEEESADQKLSYWLNLLLKKVDPYDPIVGRRSPFK